MLFYWKEDVTCCCRDQVAKLKKNNVRVKKLKNQLIFSKETILKVQTKRTFTLKQKQINWPLLRIPVVFNIIET